MTAENKQVNLPWNFNGIVRIVYQGMVPKPIGSGGSDGSSPFKMKSRGASQEIETGAAFMLYVSCCMLYAITSNQHSLTSISISVSAKQNTPWNLESVDRPKKNPHCFVQPLIVMVAFSSMLRWHHPGVLWTRRISLLMRRLATILIWLKTELSGYLESGPNTLYELTWTAS